MSSEQNLLRGPLRVQDVARHQGNRSDFLGRYEVFASRTASAGPSAVRNAARQLLEVVADTRNLMAAWEHTARYGGHAPGPDGQLLSSYSKQEGYSLVRAIGEVMLTGTYRAAKGRTVNVPKASGVGTRPLVLTNVHDRVVERAVLQVVQPLVDPSFDACSFGGRPGKGTIDALACLQGIAQTSGRLVWIADDIRDAFEHVPLSQLLDVLRSRLGDNELVSLIGRIMGTDRVAGLRQGGPLSAFLLNTYLDHFLDRPWQRRHPTVPLLRYVDDILLLCVSTEEAQLANEDLRQLLQNAGMPLKGNVDESIFDVASGDAVPWLGYQVSGSTQGLEFRLRADNHPSSWLGRLEHKLLLAHTFTDSPLRANSVILAKARDVGPAVPHTDVAGLYEQVVGVASHCGFEEIPSCGEFQAACHSSFEQWQAKCSPRQKSTQAGPGATRSQGRRFRNQVTGQLAGGEGQHVTLHAAGSFEPSTQAGSWSFVISDAGNPFPIRMSDSLPESTRNRLELLAAIKGLERIASGSVVTLESESAYVTSNIKQLPLWKANGWRCGPSGKRRPLKNADLWQRLDELLGRHEVNVRWVRGHCGDPTNERCDELARATMQAATMPGPQQSD